MFGYFLLFANMVYGTWQSLSLWKRGKRREGVALGLLSLIVAIYLVPAFGDKLPTSESVHAWMYRPLSDYVIGLLNVSKEVQAP